MKPLHYKNYLRPVDFVQVDTRDDDVDVLCSDYRQADTDYTDTDDYTGYASTPQVCGWTRELVL